MKWDTAQIFRSARLAWLRSWNGFPPTTKRAFRSWMFWRSILKDKNLPAARWCVNRTWHRRYASRRSGGDLLLSQKEERTLPKRIFFLYLHIANLWKNLRKKLHLACRLTLGGCCRLMTVFSVLEHSGCLERKEIFFLLHIFFLGNARFSLLQH